MNTKKIITILIILLLIAIIISIIILLLLYNNNEKTKYIATPATEVDTIEIEENLKEVTVRNNFYAVKNCITKFYTYYTAIYDNGSENYIIDEEEKASIENNKKRNAEVIYNLLDKEYINNKQVTKENILTKLEKINTSVVNINHMYVSQKTENISIYVAEGTLREKSSGKISDFKIMLQLDAKNRTFTVFLEDYIKEKYKDGFNIGQKLDINTQNSIEKNENNGYDYENVLDEDYATDLFNKYKEEVLYNSSLAYEHLNKEYREKRYGTVEEFQKYAKANIRNNVINQISKYQITQTDEYLQCVCIDQNGNYYIFREKAIMDYELILDTYTIELPEFIEKYNDAEENEKILLNIQKIFEAINLGDYKYVYSKLDSTFKVNYFKTQEKFEKYIKENWYSYNKVSYGSYQKNGEVYIYNIQITDGNNTGTETINKTIIMQLKEGTDFVMSFNVE